MMQKDNDLKRYTKATQVFGHLISIQQSIFFLVTEEKTKGSNWTVNCKTLESILYILH